MTTEKNSNEKPTKRPAAAARRETKMSKAMRKNTKGFTVEFATIDDATMEKEMKKARARLARPPVAVTFYLPPSLLDQLDSYTRSMRAALHTKFSRDMAVQTILARKLHVAALDPLQGRPDTWDKLDVLNEALAAANAERDA